MIVGGQPDSRGVVAACSYEARMFGIHSAMPSSQAFRRCPQAVFVPPRFEVYRDVSAQIRAIFWQYASEVEPVSLDEAYLDVTASTACHGSATRMAKAIKQAIVQQTGLIASAGVSYNKFLAKMASEQDKPNGLYVIPPDKGPDFVAQLPVGRFHGIGPATEAKMKKLKIQTGHDLRQWSQAALVEAFGKAGYFYYDIARGQDYRPVRSQRVRKSLGKEVTFAQDSLSLKTCLQQLQLLAQRVLDKLRQQSLSGQTVTIKIKYADFQQVTRSCTLDHAIEFVDIQAILPVLLQRTQVGKKPVRLVGVTLSGLNTIKQQQLSLGLNAESCRE